MCLAIPAKLTGRLCGNENVSGGREFICQRIAGMQHDVKPRVLRWLFAGKLGDAVPQTSILSASNTIREKRRLAANAAEVDPRTFGRKDWHERTLRSKS